MRLLFNRLNVVEKYLNIPLIINTFFTFAPIFKNQINKEKSKV